MAPRRPKIVFIGSGQIGATAAMLTSMKKLGNVFLFDVVEGVAGGKGLDQCHQKAVECLDNGVVGSQDPSIISGADVIILTAGVPRKPGMSRDDLLSVNAKIVTLVARSIETHAPESFVICITNPLDVMVKLLQKESGLPTNMVVGMSGILDSGRFRCHLAEKLNVSVEDVNAMVFGGHGDHMVPITSLINVAGIPIKDWIKGGHITQEEVTAIAERTRVSGGEIVGLLKTGSAFYAPASAAVQMAESYLLDRKRVLPCAAFVNGPYGVKNEYCGVPVVIGKNGVERIIEVSLTEEEQQKITTSANAVTSLYAELETVIANAQSTSA